MLLGRTLATVHNKATSGKKAKERVTISVCANVTGSIKMHGSTLKFSLTGFTSHLSRLSKKLVEQGFEPKAMLFLDNCSAHPSDKELISSDGKFCATFLPPNTTSLIQPIKQGVLECMKRLYRKSVLRDLISQDAVSMDHFLKSIERISVAWEQVSPDTIRCSWRKLLPIDKNVASMETEMIENADFVAQFVSLVALINQQDELEEAESADEVEEIAGDIRKCPIANGEAMNMLDKCLTWLCWQPEASLSNTCTLVQLREMAARKQVPISANVLIDRVHGSCCQSNPYTDSPEIWTTLPSMDCPNKPQKS
ncbi:jerky protein homolog-like [Penaeus indicus]|uniref:jerky protein homolog-like n=1 Tax=Penaeus indicus TaxID=29960 RepID=UPI00300CBDB3